MIAPNRLKLTGSGDRLHAENHMLRHRHLAATLLEALDTYLPHVPVSDEEMEEIRERTRQRVVEHWREADALRTAIDRYDATSGDGVAGMGRGR